MIEGNAWFKLNPQLKLHCLYSITYVHNILFYSVCISEPNTGDLLNSAGLTHHITNTALSGNTDMQIQIGFNGL